MQKRKIKFDQRKNEWINLEQFFIQKPSFKSIFHSNKTIKDQKIHNHKKQL